MTLETFQAVKFGVSKGGLGAIAGAMRQAQLAGVEVECCGSGVLWKWGAVEDSSVKEGEPKASGVKQAGRQHRPYSYHHQSFQSVTHKTGGGHWTRTEVWRLQREAWGERSELEW